MTTGDAQFNDQFNEIRNPGRKKRRQLEEKIRKQYQKFDKRKFSEFQLK